MVNNECTHTLKTRYGTLRPVIVLLDETDSTNDHARSLVLDGAEEGLVVVARRQRAGRGRYGRHWSSPQGGLYATFVIRPRLSAELAPMLGLLVACAVVDAVRHITGILIRLKWPNDLLIRGLKVGGILSELIFNKAHQPFALVGLGLNVNTHVRDLPLAIQGLSTSLLDESGTDTDLNQLLIEICERIDVRLRQVGSEQSYRMILDEWKSLSDTLGRMIRIERPEGALVGKAVDIDDSGSLVVQVCPGEYQIVRYGEVFHLRDKTD